MNPRSFPRIGVDPVVNPKPRRAWESRVATNPPLSKILRIFSSGIPAPERPRFWGLEFLLVDYFNPATVFLASSAPGNFGSRDSAAFSSAAASLFLPFFASTIPWW